MKKKRTKRAKIKRIANLKKNPSGGLLDVGKKALPGGAALLISLFTSSRLEALVAGAVTKPAPSFATASRMQKIVAVAAPAVMVMLAHFITKKWLQRHRVSVLVGAGTAAALRYLGIFLAYRKAAALPAAKPESQGVYEGATSSFFGLPSGTISSRVKAVETDDDPVLDDLDDLTLDGAADPDHGDLFTGNFAAGAN